MSIPAIAKSSFQRALLFLNIFEILPIQLMIATHPLDKDAMNRVSTRWPIYRILLANWYYFYSVLILIATLQRRQPTTLVTMLNLVTI
jgi:hypothetical protein